MPASDKHRWTSMSAKCRTGMHGHEGQRDTKELLAKTHWGIDRDRFFVRILGLTGQCRSGGPVCNSHGGGFTKRRSGASEGGRLRRCPWPEIADAPGSQREHQSSAQERVRIDRRRFTQLNTTSQVRTQTSRRLRPGGRSRSAGIRKIGLRYATAGTRTA